MKKVLVFVVGILAISLSLSCSNSSGPESVVKKQMECLKNRDMEGLIELQNFEEVSEDIDEQEKFKDQLISEFRKQGSNAVDDKNVIKSYEIIDTEVGDNPEPGARAIVTVKIELGNGDEKEEKIMLRMNKEGQWKLSFENWVKGR